MKQKIYEINNTVNEKQYTKLILIYETEKVYQVLRFLFMFGTCTSIQIVYVL